MEKKRILVVDDEADLREILQFNLENEGYMVDTAESAEQALKILTKEHELILLDVMMTGISGFKMAERLRKELHNTTPIIFLTAKDTENDHAYRVQYRRRRLHCKTIFHQRGMRTGKSRSEASGRYPGTTDRDRRDSYQRGDQTSYCQQAIRSTYQKRVRNIVYVSQSPRTNLFEGSYPP